MIVRESCLEEMALSISFSSSSSSLLSVVESKQSHSQLRTCPKYLELIHQPFLLTKHGTVNHPQLVEGKKGRCFLERSSSELPLKPLTSMSFFKDVPSNLLLICRTGVLLVDNKWTIKTTPFVYCLCIKGKHHHILLGKRI